VSIRFRIDSSSFLVGSAMASSSYLADVYNVSARAEHADAVQMIRVRRKSPEATDAAYLPDEGEALGRLLDAAEVQEHLLPDLRLPPLDLLLLVLEGRQCRPRRRLAFLLV
jgi:hypothetical protein